MSAYVSPTVRVPPECVEHVDALLSHLHRTARLAVDCEKAAMALEPVRFRSAHKELEGSQQYRESLVVLVQVAWATALSNESL